MAVQPPLLYSIAYTHAYQNTDMHMNTHSALYLLLCFMVWLCCLSCKLNQNTVCRSMNTFWLQFLICTELLENS